MTQYEYNHSGDGAAPADRQASLIAAGSGLALLVVAAISGLYLYTAYRQAEPYRAEQARLAQDRRLAADQAAAEQERQAAAPIPGSTVDVSVPDIGGERIGQPSGTSSTSAKASHWVPLEWAVPPRYRVQPDQLRGDFSRVSARLTCVASPDGRLSQCRGVDTPAGSGLAALLAPQLAQARVVPSRVDGQAVSTTVSLTVSYEIERRVAPRTPMPSMELPPRDTPFLPTNNAPQTESLPPSIIPAIPGPVAPTPAGTPTPD